MCIRDRGGGDYTNPEGHVTVHSEEAGRRERRRLWSVCCGHNNKSSAGAGNCDILAEKERHIREEHI